VNFLNQRGRANLWINDGRKSVKWTRLSDHDLRHNRARLLLVALAYNLGNLG
jgi:hypothetical protein